MGTIKRLFVWLGLCLQLGTNKGAHAADLMILTTKSANIIWSPYTGASSYKISAAATVSPGIVVSYAQFGPSVVLGSVISLSANTAYTFTVEALDSNLNVLQSSQVVGTTAPDVMDPPTVETVNSTALRVVFNMGAAINAIVRIQGPNGFIKQVQTASSPVEINCLEPYTEYTIRLIASSSYYYTQPSYPVSAKTALPPPQLYTSSPSSDTIDVSWNAVDDADKYTVSIYNFETGTVIEEETTQTILSISGLVAGSLYVISAYAWDIDGEQGEASADYNQVTRPPPPDSISMTYNEVGSLPKIVVSWGFSPNLYGTIDVTVTSNSGHTCTGSSMGGSCALLSVSCGEEHTIHLVASNDAGSSIQSSPQIFHTVPCPPQSLAVLRTTVEDCALTWDTVDYADSYLVYVDKGQGDEEVCNVIINTCTYECLCGYTFLISVYAVNTAGHSPPGEYVNQTTVPCCPEDVVIFVESTDTLEITWTPPRGGMIYQTEAVAGSEVILCNNTEPVCALSDLTCDTPYSVVVTPCNDISGCNNQCQAYTKDTAACVPTDVALNELDHTNVNVRWTLTNREANYTVSAEGDDGTFTCITIDEDNCVLANLPCGSIFQVSVRAESNYGHSLPSYSETVETVPCCPQSLTVNQVTQATSQVTWSEAKGAASFITSLTSPHGEARCHTDDLDCIMGCITCGTSYTVHMQAYSHSGRQADCAYEGFSTSACCPTFVKLYRLASPNSLKIYWRNSAADHRHQVDMTGTSNNYSCSALEDVNTCNIDNIQCGDTYHVVVSPLTGEGQVSLFCPARVYAVTCSNNNIAAVLYRGKRSVE